MNAAMNPHGEHPTLKRGLLQAAILTAIMYSALGCYLFVLKWRGDAATVKTWLPLDEWLPFWPSWVWVYLIPYLVAPFLFAIMTPGTFFWFLTRGLTVIGITLAIFVVFPTQTDNKHRAEDVGTGTTADLYRWMIEIDDPPANAAPSLHVSLTFLLLLGLLRDHPRGWPVWVAFVGLIWASTLVIRQHHLIDVTSALLLAWIVVVGLDRLRKPSSA